MIHSLSRSMSDERLMDIDLDVSNLKADQLEEELSSLSIQKDSEGAISNAESEYNEEISQSMEKLLIVESSASSKRKPVVVIVVGMAGSGKTTFLHRLVCHTQALKMHGYVINLDPAVTNLPFGSNIDIRDSFNYKELMNQFNMAPSEGILSSLSLFATNFNEVIPVIEGRADQLDYVLVDTPGQIEIITWSASREIITEGFASTFPTVIAYVVDTPRASSPVTFMSNMLNACSIFNQTRVPLVLVFSKTDLAQHQFALEWMEDFEVFRAALESYQSYNSTLTRNLSLVLDEFCKSVSCVRVSAVSGAGINEFFKAIEASAEQCIESHRADLEQGQEKQRLVEEWMWENMFKLRKDMDKSRETLVLSTLLKYREAACKAMLDYDNDKDLDYEEYDILSEDEEDMIDEEEDEEVDPFFF